MENDYQKSIEELEKYYGTNIETGLDNNQVEDATKKYGLNELKEKKKKTIIARVFDQLKDFALIILIIAAIISAIVAISNGESPTDTYVILVVIAINCIIGVMQELKAEKSLDALKKLTQNHAKVIRNGKLEVIESNKIVPGDILVLDTGDCILADGKIIESSNFQVQESSLTGESVPVLKQAGEILEQTNLGDRTNMVFSSTLVTNGRATVLVTKTGMESEVGKIAKLLDDVEEQETPMQEKLNKLSKVLAIVAVILCVLIFFVGVLYKKPIFEMLMTSISLAVAVIPESLVTISTIVLAIGVQKMAKKNAIIKHLPSVETLGSATYICSDKTGTLTQNKMTVTKLFYDNQLYDILELKEDEKENEIENENRKENRKENKKEETNTQKLLVKSMYLCNDTKIDTNGKLSGDPTETALFDMAFSLGYLPKDLEDKRLYDIPFDSNRKLMTTVNYVDKKVLVFVKGGIDELFNITNSIYLDGRIIDKKEEVEKYLENAKKQNEIMAKNSLRVLACGFKVLKIPFFKKEEIEDYIEKHKDELEKNICFVGLVGMIDPPRKEVKNAIAKTKTAGITTVMITGDHMQTAYAIANELGIVDDISQAVTGNELENMTDEELKQNVKEYKVYSRVSPEHKVRIVKALQDNGQIVAMTGDGVNDSPALKRADIGCSMGKVGTDVAKGASDVILADDNFSTIVNAVEEGRRIYDNILKAIEFLLSSNIGETVCILLATLFIPLIASYFKIPLENVQVLLPIQILLINLVTDSFPALGFAFMMADDDIMQRKPNTSKHIFTKGFTWRIIYQGMMIGILTFIAFLLGLNTSKALPGLSLEQTKIEVAQTMAFITLAFAELVHVFNIVNTQKTVFKSNIFKNKVLISSVVLSAFLMLFVIFVPFMRNLFKIVLLPKTKVIELIALIIAPLVIVEIMKLFKLNGKRV